MQAKSIVVSKFHDARYQCVPVNDVRRVEKLEAAHTLVHDAPDLVTTEGQLLQAAVALLKDQVQLSPSQGFQNRFGLPQQQ